jgi:hypothetical protein
MEMLVKRLHIYMVFVLAAMSAAKGGEAMSLSELVPREYRGWAADGQDGDYTQEGIYKYMDGAGELYREYEYRELFVRKFLKAGQPVITVELFDMGTPSRAFGVFAHTRDGAEAGVGQDSEYRAGLLRGFCVSGKGGTSPACGRRRKRARRRRPRWRSAVPLPRRSKRLVSGPNSSTASPEKG